MGACARKSRIHATLRPFPCTNTGAPMRVSSRGAISVNRRKTGRATMTIGMVGNIRRVALIVTAIWFGLSGSIALAAAVGQFQFVSGDVRVQRAGQTLTATKGNEVQEGDVIVTGSPADAQLRMIDSAFIAIKANSQLRIDQYTYRPANASEDNAVLSLLVGTMRAFTGALVQRNKDKFSMKTLTANVGLRGSGNILSAAAD